MPQKQTTVPELTKQAALVFFRTGMTPLQMEEALRIFKQEIQDLKEAIETVGKKRKGHV